MYFKQWFLLCENCYKKQSVQIDFIYAQNARLKLVTMLNKQSMAFI